MIVLFTCGGRTGNKLFQLFYAVRNRRAHEWIISVGFSDVRSLLAGDWKRTWIDISRPFLRTLIESIVYPYVFHALVKTGFASSHYEQDSGITIRQGKLRRLTIMRGYFEISPAHFDNSLKLFFLKRSLTSRVRPFLESLPAGKRRVFLHIRRSDFKDRGMALPERYYRAAIQLMQKRHPDIFLVIVGDDPDYAHALFRDIAMKTISRLSASEDLALMSLCDGGILSNSTFSWWGGFFGKCVLGCVAPRYWQGWQRKAWTPPHIQAPFMTDLIEL